jgi:hypothetical protein
MAPADTGAAPTTVTMSMAAANAARIERVERFM